MATRLPTPGADAGNWGTILNEFLEVEHSTDGTLKDVARQADLDTKANTSDLGTAATADTSDFATATQGALADTAVQTDNLDSLIEAHADVAANTGARHEHANKDVLDTVVPELLVPGGGVRGQVLVAGDGGERDWRAPAGPTPFAYHLDGFISTSTHGLGEISRSNILMLDGHLFMAAIFIPVASTLAIIGTHVTEASASGSVRLGMFTVTPGTRNAALVVDAGTVSTATTGTKNIGSIANPIGTQLSAGWYWVAVQAEEDFQGRVITPARYLSTTNLVNAGGPSMLYLPGQSGPFPGNIAMSWATGVVFVAHLHLRAPQS